MRLCSVALSVSVPACGRPACALFCRHNTLPETQAFFRGWFESAKAPPQRQVQFMWTSATDSNMMARVLLNCVLAAYKTELTTSGLA